MIESVGSGKYKKHDPSLERGLFNLTSCMRTLVPSIEGEGEVLSGDRRV